MSIPSSDDGVIEQAILPIRAGETADFEDAFAEARPIIERAQGFRWLRLQRGIERRNEYLLLVGWDTVDSHRVGFRTSPDYETWRRLLHHFYDPFPTVHYFVTVAD
ncbi:MAG: antibiotic biosynthesis monooxygenase [Actinobacteria bacterium]|nr:antibiotic biosynthesis monooxygenase [Actinomycetota bacterium]